MKIDEIVLTNQELENSRILEESRNIAYMKIAMATGIPASFFYITDRIKIQSTIDKLNQLNESEFRQLYEGNFLKVDDE